MNKRNSFFEDPGLTVFLAVTAPSFFIWGVNAHMFASIGLFMAMLITVLVALFASFITQYLYRMLDKYSQTIPKLVIYSIVFVFTLVIVETCCFFLQSSLFAVIPEPRWLRILATRILPFFFCIGILYKFGLKPINVFLTIFLFISLSTIGIKTATAVSKMPSASITSETADQRVAKNHLSELTLKKTPNIYLFFLESYHSLDVQRDVYGINTATIESYLQKNSFVDYGKVYSSTPSTLLSIAGMFYFEHVYALGRGDSDAVEGVRRLIGGDEHNTLFKILKKNNYTTVFLGEAPFYGLEQGEYLDYSLFMIPKAESFKLVLTHALEAIRMLNSRFKDGSMLTKLLPTTIVHEKRLGMIKQVQKIAEARQTPLFVHFKGGADHTPMTHSWERHNEWVQSNAYQKMVEGANAEIMQICDHIITHDPDSIIILIGDHGAHRYRNAAEPSSTHGDVYKNLEMKNISLQDYCDDYFAVLFSVRLPSGATEDISHGKVMNHVNIFTHIFSYINDDESLINSRAGAKSYYGKIPMVDDGMIIAPRMY